MLCVRDAMMAMGMPSSVAPRRLLRYVPLQSRRSTATALPEQSHHSRAIATEPPQPVAQEQRHCTSRAITPAETPQEQAEPAQHSRRCRAVGAQQEQSLCYRSRATARSRRPLLHQAAQQQSRHRSTAAAGPPPPQSCSRAVTAVAAAGKLPPFMSVHVVVMCRVRH